MQFFEDFKDLAEMAKDRCLPSTGLDDRESFSNPVCGDQIWVNVELQGDTVSALTYSAQGCWPVYGCLELLRQRIVHLEADQVLKYSLKQFLSEVDSIPVSKRHAFSLVHRGVLATVVKACAERNLKQMVGLSSKERLY